MFVWWLFPIHSVVALSSYVGHHSTSVLYVLWHCRLNVIFVILTAVFLSIQVFWYMTQRHAVLCQKTWIFQYKCPFCSQCSKARRDERCDFKFISTDGDRAKCIGTATRLYIVELTAVLLLNLILPLCSYFWWGAAFHQCRFHVRTIYHGVVNKQASWSSG